MSAYSIYENPEAMTKVIQHLEKEKRDIEVRISCYEEANTTKLDAKSEKAMNYYKQEVANATAIYERKERSINNDEEAELQRVRDKYERKRAQERQNQDNKTQFYGNLIAGITPIAPPKPERILRDEKKLADIDAELYRYKLFQSSYAKASEPDYVSEFKPEPEPFKPYVPPPELQEEERRLAKLREWHRANPDPEV